MPADVEHRVVQALMARRRDAGSPTASCSTSSAWWKNPSIEPDDDVIVFPGVAAAPEHDDPTDPTDPTDPADAVALRLRWSLSVRRRRWPVLAAAAAVIALLAIAGVNLFGQTRSGSDGLASLPGPSGQASPTVSVATAVTGRLHLQASGVAYTADTLASGARALIVTPGKEVGADQAAALGPLATTEGANACVAALGDADAPSVTVDLATYAGQPAAIVVIAREGKTTAYAVQRGCATGDPEVIKDAVPVP